MSTAAKILELNAYAQHYTDAAKLHPYINPVLTSLDVSGVAEHMLHEMCHAALLRVPYELQYVRNDHIGLSTRIGHAMRGWSDTTKTHHEADALALEYRVAQALIGTHALKKAVIYRLGASQKIKKTWLDKRLRLEFGPWVTMPRAVAENIMLDAHGAGYLGTITYIP